MKVEVQAVGLMDLLDERDGSVAVMRNLSQAPGDPTPALVSCVKARVTADAVELEWYSPDAMAFDAEIERATVADDAWRVVARVRADGRGHVSWRDPRPRPRRPTRAIATALRIAGANPGAGPPAFDLSLAQPGEATLEILDVNGQRFGTRRVRFTEAGARLVSFAGVDLPAGLYFARARTIAGVSVVRFAIVR